MNLLETRNIVSWNLPEQIVFLEKIATLALRVSHFCCCSVAQSCLTLCYPMNCSTPGLPVYHHLPEFAQVHVHCIVMPSSHLIFWHPLLLLPSMFPRIRNFSSESAIQIRWPEYWSFSFSISPSSEYSVFPFKIDWFDLLAVWGTLRSLLQHHSLKASILWCSALFMVQLSQPYVTTGKTTALTIRTFVGRVMSVLSTHCLGFHTFLPRSNRPLISCLQSPSIVILEPKKNKSVIASTFSPSICYELMGWMLWS